jgi:hypothetical protein
MVCFKPADWNVNAYSPQCVLYLYFVFEDFDLPKKLQTRNWKLLELAATLIKGIDRRFASNRFIL